ncbi:hypothetical protein [Streptomyces sp. NBC_00122]|uniref:hypothetical protein n=1 Tax=Streptomyces sp. NBC_00122 TaxID=2903623 RepID=UPI00324B7C09
MTISPSAPSWKNRESGPTHVLESRTCGVSEYPSWGISGCPHTVRTARVRQYGASVAAPLASVAATCRRKSAAVAVAAGGEPRRLLTG